MVWVPTSVQKRSGFVLFDGAIHEPCALQCPPGKTGTQWIAPISSLAAAMSAPDGWGVSKRTLGGTRAWKPSQHVQVQVSNG